MASSTRAAIVFVASIALIGCDPFRPAISLEIVEGAKYAHYVHFPSGFDQPPYVSEHVFLDHLIFRASNWSAGTDQSSEPAAWKFRGKKYSRSADWITGLILLASGDGDLVLLAGIDKRKLPKYPVLVGDPVGGGLYGNMRIDAFDGDPSRRIASVDVDCGMASLECMAYVSIANARWFAIARDRALASAVIFDFGDKHP